MNIVSIFCVAALLVSNNPAANFCAPINTDTAAQIKQAIVNNQYNEKLDYNGDGRLTAKDSVLVERRYQNNLINGNQITIDSETAMAIITENYDTPIDWEFCEIDNQITRVYSITTNKIIPATIRAEFEDFTVKYIEIEINPFEETVYVKEGGAR